VSEIGEAAHGVGLDSCSGAGTYPWGLFGAGSRVLPPCPAPKRLSHADVRQEIQAGNDMSRPATFEAAPRLFDGIIDRAQTEMPNWYLPSADGALIAGEDMLDAVGHRSGVRHPAGWSRGISGFKKTARDGTTVLWVQQCGNFWIIERSLLLHGGYMKDETLVFVSGSRPIWTRTRQAAMQLAEHCDPMPRDPVAGYWADVGNVRVLSAQLPYRSAG
jgi:hypothetical protein